MKKICGLWEHGERITKYIPSASLRTGLRRGLLPAALVDEVWAKWFAPERSSELRENPEAVADVILFDEVHRLAAFESGG